MKIYLPLPDPKLSPNARCHWRPKAKATEFARECAYKITFQRRFDEEFKGPFNAYRLKFFWKTNRRRDDDNAAASCKAFRDGIAAALRIDDHTLKFHGPAEMLCLPGQFGTEFELFWHEPTTPNPPSREG